MVTPAGPWGGLWRELGLGREEDIFLRLINIVDESGTGFAFPSTVNYLARDGGIDAERTERTEAIMRALRDGKALPFPDFDVEIRKKIRDTLNYPPEGSTETDGRGGANCQLSIRDPWTMKHLSTAVAPRDE